MERGLRGLKGFSLIEIMFTTGILAIVLCGLLVIYVNLFLLGDIARQLTLATNSAQAKLEEIKKENFDTLDTYNSPPKNTFDIAGFNSADAKGAITVSNTGYSDLKLVRLVVCFRQKGARIIGEDKNLNGTLDIAQGEDANGNGRLDSAVELVTLISR